MVYTAILSKVAGPLENIVMHQSVYFIIQFKKKKTFHNLRQKHCMNCTGICQIKHISLKHLSM